MLIFSKLTFNRHDGKHSLVTSPKRGDAERQNLEQGLSEQNTPNKQDSIVTGIPRYTYCQGGYSDGKHTGQPEAD
jgi:hypothetical protein